MDSDIPPREGGEQGGDILDDREPHPGNAEVGELDVTRAGEEDVGRLEVPAAHSGPRGGKEEVRGREGGGRGRRMSRSEAAMQ